MILVLLVLPLVVAFVLRGRRGRVAKRASVPSRFVMPSGVERRHGPGSSGGSGAGAM